MTRFCIQTNFPEGNFATEAMSGGRSSQAIKYSSLVASWLFGFLFAFMEVFTTEDLGATGACLCIPWHSRAKPRRSRSLSIFVFACCLKRFMSGHRSPLASIAEHLRSHTPPD
jgi:hypothetical protein